MKIINFSIDRCWHTIYNAHRFLLRPIGEKMEIKKTEHYVRWMAELRDERAKARISNRVFRLANGNPGDAQPVGEGVSEMRIHYGPGYRVYYKKVGLEIVILLIGGTKSTQSADIALAKKLASNF